ncbi:MAG: hypothetical protein ACOC3S_03430 [Bacteroidota bacterium]
MFRNKIYIIHYHLNPGGVTSIIKSQVKGLKSVDSNSEITVITGVAPMEKILNKDVKLIVNKRLNYLSLQKINNPRNYCNKLLKQLKKIVRKNDIIHFHNLNLGKNPLVNYVIYQLIQEGYPVFNHVHDFAEDRSVNMALMQAEVGRVSDLEISEIMYPSSPNLYYGVLTSFDHERLKSLGVKQEKIKRLPNPVSIPALPEPQNNKKLKEQLATVFNIDPEKKWITYPVRVIKRKNIGEFVLLAYLFASKAVFLVTQPPANPAEMGEYKKWVQFCHLKNIPVIWEAGRAANFSEIISASDFCITTSVMEGFGMSYLEPWLHHTPVTGRNILRVTPDFIKLGLEFPVLYDGIQINTGEKLIDFAELDSTEQRFFIGQLGIPEIREQLISGNPFIDKLFEPVEQKIIIKNEMIVRENFSVAKYGETLHGIYEEITGGN